MIERLNGYKTIIAGVLHAAWFAYYMFIDNTVESEMQWRGHGVIGILTGVGLVHKGYKNKDSINSGMNKVKQTFKNK